MGVKLLQRLTRYSTKAPALSFLHLHSIWACCFDLAHCETRKRDYRCSAVSNMVCKITGLSMAACTKQVANVRQGSAISIQETCRFLHKLQTAPWLRRMAEPKASNGTLKPICWYRRASLRRILLISKVIPLSLQHCKHSFIGKRSAHDKPWLCMVC